MLVRSLRPRPVKSGRRGLQSYMPLIWATFASALTLSLVAFPKEAFDAATDGLHIFWDIVFPSLLPFFVLSEILLGLGVVHFLGVLLEPLMRPVFNVPGVGAFALSMGLAAGYPMDAVITAKFRKMNLCTRVEGERLLAFTNTADPLFILGAVAVGMFHSPKLGFILAMAHYLASFTVGIVFRYYRRHDTPSSELGQMRDVFILRKAARELLRARREDGRSFGKLLGEAVTESITTLLMICGFIMLFAVVVKVAGLVGLTALITPVIGSILKLFGLDPSLADAVFRGLLEIDLGTIASAKASAQYVDRAVVASFIIAWSGLSVFAQVASVVIGSDVKMGPYAIARLLQGFFAGFFTWLLMEPLGWAFGWSESVFASIAVMSPDSPLLSSSQVVEKWFVGGCAALGISGLLVGASLVTSSFGSLKRLIARALR